MRLLRAVFLIETESPKNRRPYIFIIKFLIQFPTLIFVCPLKQFFFAVIMIYMITEPFLRGNLFHIDRLYHFLQLHDRNVRCIRNQNYFMNRRRENIEVPPSRFSASSINFGYAITPAP